MDLQTLIAALVIASAQAHGLPHKAPAVNPQSPAAAQAALAEPAAVETVTGETAAVSGADPFTAHDSDGDGRLSPDEMLGYIVESSDSNRDAVISDSEIAIFARNFQQFYGSDSNRNGLLEIAEWRPSATGTASAPGPDSPPAEK